MVSNAFLEQEKQLIDAFDFEREHGKLCRTKEDLERSHARGKRTEAQLIVVREHIRSWEFMALCTVENKLLILDSRFEQEMKKAEKAN